ncbi:hypothetical protein D3C85_1444280 [compost metagenome]
MVLVTPLNPPGSSFSLRKNCPSRVGKGLSAAPNSSCPGTRLFKLPSTVRRPNAPREFGRISSRLSPAAWRSENLIWSRMNCRSPRIRCTPPLIGTVGLSSGITAGGVGTTSPSTSAVGVETAVSMTPSSSW